MKVLGRLVLIVVMLLVVAGVLLWRVPLWTERQVTHADLFLAHVQSNYVLTPEGRVHYYEAESSIPGGGIPVVLIHGLGDRDESWAPMLKRLKGAGFHVYAPDLLGYGRSPKPENGDYTMAGETRFVDDFIQSLGLQRTDVGGWSMGGWIALDLAHAHPELVNRVVVFDGAALTFKPDYPFSVLQPKTPAEVARLWSLLEPEAKPLPENVRQAVVRQQEDVSLAVSKNMASMLQGRTLEAMIPQIPEPLLIVWGSVDRLIPLQVGQRMHALDPRSELDIVEGCGHLEPALCAGRVAPAVADFLKANPPPEGGVRTLTNMHR